MTLEQELEAAAGAARAHAAGEPVAAVMAAQPGRSDRVYLIALGRDPDHRYLALDDRLQPVTDRRLVRDAVVMLGLAERAEEASIAIHADELDAPFAAAQAALEQAGRAQQATAAAEVRAALAAPYPSAARRRAVEEFVADIPLEPEHVSAPTLDG
ncbi:MAG TPA: hypothetical protein VFJ66_02585, partial [Gaiellales bacterium]|nr:hypothetical protein [Gaiellales bacterium]